MLGGDGKGVQECVRQTSIVMKGKADDGDFDKEKLAALWRDPSLRGHDLGMWLANSPLGKGETIVLYRDHVAAYPGKISMVRAPVEDLAEYAHDFPDEVADSLYSLVDKCDDYVPEATRNVLALLLDVDDAQVRKKCRDIIEAVAQRGHDWRDLLEK